MLSPQSRFKGQQNTMCSNYLCTVAPSSLRKSEGEGGKQKKKEGGCFQGWGKKDFGVFQLFRLSYSMKYQWVMCICVCLLLCDVLSSACSNHPCLCLILTCFVSPDDSVALDPSRPAPFTLGRLVKRHVETLDPWDSMPLLDAERGTLQRLSRQSQAKAVGQ